MTAKDNTAKRRASPEFQSFISNIAVIIAATRIFTDKTRLSIILTSVVIFVVGLYPATHLDFVALSKFRKRAATLTLLLLVSAWTWAVWPTEKPPHSDLRIEVVQFKQPFKGNEPPHMDVQVANDSPYTRQTFSFGLMKAYDSLPDDQTERQVERQLWSSLEKKIEESRQQMTKEEFYGNAILPRVPSVVPLEPQNKLTESQAAWLQSENGPAFLYAMSVYLYRGDTGEFGVSNSVFTQGGANHLPNRCRTGHNGPIKFKPDHWWSLSSD